MASFLAESAHVYFNAALAIRAVAIVFVIQDAVQGLVVWVEVALYQYIVESQEEMVAMAKKGGK
jgi:hypothetical protein